MAKKTTTEVISRGLLIDRGRVLMCRNIELGYFYLPGGHIEFAEKASDALSREILEETGLESTIGPLLLTSEQCFHDGKRVHHELNTVFLVEHLGPSDSVPEPVPSIEEKIDFVWLELAEVGQADVRPESIKAWLMSGGTIDESHGPWLSGFEHTAS